MSGTDERVALAAVFADLVAVQVAPFGIPDLAQRLVDGCVDVLDVWAAGLLVTDPGSTPKVLASSTHEAGLLELVQVRSGQGPCLAAIATGEVVAVDDVTAMTEVWPQWTASAAALGIRRAYGIPLRAQGEVVGALNLFRTDRGPLAASDVSVAVSLADVATVGILQHRAMEQANGLALQLQRALESRVVIEQAKGALAERADISVAEAFVRLRSHARQTSRPLGEVATAVVEGTLDLS
ncbi:MAG: GAF and ANTAR domain-containing protein [Cellulomonadaceae bacterium]|nr:GAF and ANTAR domain-containing protein [Cellulomonadaceae bacterium]